MAGDYLWSRGAISDETLMLEKTVCNDSKFLRELVHEQLSQGCNDVFNRVSEEISEDVQHDDLLLPQCLPSRSAEQFRPKGKKHGKIHAAVYIYIYTHRPWLYICFWIIRRLKCIVRACMHKCEKLIKMGAFFLTTNRLPEGELVATHALKEGYSPI